MTAGFDLAGEGSWEDRLRAITKTVRELSHVFEPAAMVNRYVERMQQLMPARRLLTLTRRGFEAPRYGLAEVRSWEERAELRRDPAGFNAVEGGLLGRLLYAGEPRIIDELEVTADDPLAEHLAGQGSLIAIPIFEQGEAVEMVVHTRDHPRGFNPDHFPDFVWLTNVLARSAFQARRMEDLQRAHRKLDRDLAYIAELQHALLPRKIPEIAGVSIDVRSQPSERSGGDYYDFFQLPEGRLGILLADVSGHGTATAVLMAITHAIARLHPPAVRPSGLLSFVNRQLVARYTAGTNAFVTAFHGIYDPAGRKLAYSLAGHPSPRLLRDGRMILLDETRRPPLGVEPGQKYVSATVAIRPGDELVVFTDGISEARDAADGLFGEERLDEALVTVPGAGNAVARVSSAIAAFIGDRALEDDWTVLGVRFG